MPDPDRPTAHLAALCPRCDVAFVAFTIPPGGVALDVAAARFARVTCPGCGCAEGITWLVGPRHAEAVARLRREAALD